jgi:hypothetical protein
MPRRGKLDASLSSWKSTFSPRPVHVQFAGMVVVVEAVMAVAVLVVHGY